MRPTSQVVMTFTWCLLAALLITATSAQDGNRFTYLDEPCDPYYVGRDFPKLVTGQWVGEPNVEAVVILAIDDMRDTKKYETYLRPILDRLKEIDGRTPVSIMTCRVAPDDPQLKVWIDEGVSIECHTLDHPCPFLQGGDLAKAKATYDGCVDLLASIPGNQPVAFRVPCCDSLNTPSPRFWTEIVHRTSPQNHFLHLDSSVFNITTPQDSSLPNGIALDADGQERFRKYLPFPSFVNTIEDYPYPYVIAGRSWEFPCTVPSDWEAQHLHQPNNPRTVDDLKRALDATVIKQGVLDLVFHPHGWIRNDQVNELIDYAVEEYGTKVKFLTFREAIDRIHQHLLLGQPLRDTSGREQGVRLIDLDSDGYLDVVIGNAKQRVTRRWNADQRKWEDSDFPLRLDDHQAGSLVGAKFGTFAVPDSRGSAAGFVCRDGMYVYHDQWERIEDDNVSSVLLQAEKNSPQAHRGSLDGFGVRLRDLDLDGNCELLISNPQFQQAYTWVAEDREWKELPHALPANVPFVDTKGGDAGLRFVDLNRDGREDIVFSNSERYAVHLFHPSSKAWTTPVAGRRDQPAAGPVVPMIVRSDGSNNGVWFHSNTMWVQNEDTHRLPDLVDRIAFDRLIDPPTQIGAASIEITPQHPIRLSGYGSRMVEASDVAQPLFAKALAVGSNDATGPALLLTFENCGLTPKIRGLVTSRLAEDTGISEDRIVIAVSHSHTAPCLPDWAPYLFGADLPPDQRQRIEQYAETLVEKLVQVAKEALANRRPGRLSWAQGNLGFAVNRRVLNEGTWTGFGEQVDGPVDHRLPVLVAHDSDGEVIAVVANYACHCTTLGGNFNQVHGDWVGYAQAFLEEDHPGAVALITIGCGADANPSPRGEEAMCRQHGRALADEVARLLKGPLRPLSATLECRQRSIELPFETLPSREDWEAKAKEGGAVGYHARQFLERLDRGETLPESIDYPIATWCFGNDLAMVFLAGEVVVDYSIRFQEMFDADRVWVTAYANEVPCYIPSKRILREGGYEADYSMVYYARPARLAPQTEDLISHAVQKLLPPRFYSDELQRDFPPPREPEEALKSFRTSVPVHIELVATEPLVVDPVAFDWGPDGRLWVVEMRDYPNGLGWNSADDPPGSHGGRVKVLDDLDRDGRFDHATLFLDNIPYPTGIKVWRDGVLITAAPEVFFAKDEDGDDIADHRVTLYKGFGEGNQQHRVNGLRWGLDQWLYVANGDSGGRIETVSGESVSVSGRDLKIAPDRGTIVTQSGQTQFGRCRDDEGNWFGGNNSNPVWHYVLDDEYLRRNPEVHTPGVRREIATVPGAAPVFPASRTLARFNDFDRVDRFTSACSPMVFRDLSAIQADPRRFVYVCEPVHNLVHRSEIEDAGVSFVSRRETEEQTSEFLASTDNWFRPTMVRTGPDGALWVSDMYRFVIEHPTWVPTEWQRKLDLRAGDARGRIYRITLPDTPRRDLPRLTQMDTSQLVAALDDPNGTRRDMVHQVLFWRRDPQSGPLLRELFLEAKWQPTRLHILYLLHDLEQLPAELLVTALQHPDAVVRRHAVRLAEGRFATDESVAKAVLDLAQLPSTSSAGELRLQLQLAYSLGEWNDQRAGEALATLALRHRDQPYLLAAVLSSLHQENLVTFADGVLDAPELSDTVFVGLLHTAIGLNDTATQVRGIRKLTTAGPQGFEQSHLVRLDHVLTKIDRAGGVRQLPQEVTAGLESMFRECRRIAAGETPAETELREAAVRAIGHSFAERKQVVATLAELLTPQTPLSLQQAALEGLGRLGTADVPDQIFPVWNSLSPKLRDRALDLLIAKEMWCKQLIEAIALQEIPASALDARRRQQLLFHRSQGISTLAAERLPNLAESNRQELVARYEQVISDPAHEPDPIQGEALFAKHCAKCHRFQEKGFAVGPDLAAIANKSPTALLTAILDPNRAVEDKFLDYVCVTVDGRQYSGMIVGETSNSLTLTEGENKQVTLLRNQIEDMRATGKSLMPEGLEKELQPADVANLIAHIQSVRPQPKSFPGNEPQVAPVRDDGSIRLFAVHCSIFGPSLVFESRYRNLGYWGDQGDFAIWKVNVPKAGRYRVELDYACADEVAGNHFHMEVSGQSLGGRVEGTGSWDDYRSATLGTLQLAAGETEVIVRSDGPVQGFLMDLRTIRLYPQ